jgi:EAL domain-containing protein (putative c-di-GMP-specific phosphodiesterase class I)
MHQKAVSFLQLETDLQRAVCNQEFILHYQPIVCLDNNQIIGAEALIRWQHPQKGLISPNNFIPLAEETNLIVPIGLWVIQEACLQLARWQHPNSSLKSLELEINLSVQQLAQPDLIEQIEQAIQATKIQRQKLKLEITESIFMQRVKTSQLALERLQSQGLELILDDFGTGYSSLEYLQKLPISTLKIDRSFVMNLEHNEHNQNIVEATINLSHTLGLSVVAEGIETPKQLAILKSLGCDYGQGYLFSRPVEIDTLEKVVTDFNQQK